MQAYQDLYKECRLCPRECGVDRTGGETGFCGESAVTRIAWAGLHRGEEPPITGEAGSGTIFFTGCTLRCAFCQNRQLSRGESGREVSVEELAVIFLDLQNEGVVNINFVTGTHFIPGILEALDRAREKGLVLPVVWNSSGYERPEILKLLASRVNLWLPDLKTRDTELSRKLFGAPGYPEAAEASLKYIAGLLKEDGPAGIPWEGGELKLILRHLILPGHLESTRRVLEFYAGPVRGRIGGGTDALSEVSSAGSLLSLMTQYVPVRGADPGAPDRFLTSGEAYAVYDMLDELGIEDGFFQGPPEEGAAGTEGEWEPDFDRTTPFPEGWVRKVWHWREN